MFLKVLVPIPKDEKGISKKTIDGITYVYYTYERHYDPKKKYTVGSLTSIGKCESRDSDMMYPNTNYLKYFPDAEVPETKNISERSGVLKVGPYLAIKKVAKDYHLDDMLADIIGEDAGLFLDLAAYSIIAENNANQYYPDYAFDHPLFTKAMRIYSDSILRDFINGISRSQVVEFLSRWNLQHDHRQKIYISYDSIDEDCEDGDIGLVEYGYAKDDRGKVIENCDTGNGGIVIITAQSMTAKEALELYKNRCAAEKLLLQSKVYIQPDYDRWKLEALNGAEEYRSFRVLSEESLHGTILIEFVALIIRNRLYGLMKEYVMGTGSEEKYFTVPAAMRELGKVEMVRQADGEYRLERRVTGVCKELFMAVGMGDGKVREGVREVKVRLR